MPGQIEIRDDFPDVPLVSHGTNGSAASETQSRACECCGDGFVSLMEEGRFRHLNKTKNLGSGPVDWLLGPVREDRLWTITLHYHSWAWALAERVIIGGDDAPRADACLRRLLVDWIANCDLTAEWAHGILLGMHMQSRQESAGGVACTTSLAVREEGIGASSK